MPAAFTDGSWQIGYIVLFVALIVLALAAIGALALAVLSRDQDDRVLFLGAMVGIVVTGAIVSLFGLPYDAKYYKYYTVEGKITKVTNVLTDGDGDLTRTPVIQIEGVDQPIAVEDPRIMTLDGKDLVLRCEIDWHYQAADSYSCSIKSYKFD